MKIDLNIQYDQSVRFLISLLFPLIIYICMFTLFIALEIVVKKYRFYRLIIVFIIINIFIQPSLVIEGFRGLNCTQLYDNRSFLTVDLRMECFTEEYYSLVDFFSSFLFYFLFIIMKFIIIIKCINNILISFLFRVLILLTCF